MFWVLTAKAVSTMGRGSCAGEAAPLTEGCLPKMLGMLSRFLHESSLCCQPMPLLQSSRLEAWLLCGLHPASSLCSPFLSQEQTQGCLTNTLRAHLWTASRESNCCHD